VNREIRAPRVRVIDEFGEQLGLMSSREALQLAMDRELDLVEIAPQATPPVCKIIDFGKFRYEQQKREKTQRKNQHNQQMKEVRLHPRTDTHDAEFKTRHAREFLAEGHKVKFTVVFRGREITHQNIGRELLEGIIQALAEEAKIDQPIRMDGRNMSLILAPDIKKKKV
jgi:translation initiation factor IF-3